MKKLFLLIVVLVCGFFAYQHFMGGAPQEGFQGGGGLPVTAYTVNPEKISDEIKSVGNVESNESAKIRAEVAGQIMAINFTEGQKVKKGELLIQIDDRTLKQEAARAEAAYDIAEITFSRKNELHKSGAVAVQVKDEAEAKMRSAEADFKEAKIRLEKSSVRAPFDGIVGLRKLNLGDYVNVGDEITHVVAIDPMKIEFSIPEKYFVNLKEGLTVEFSVDSWPNRIFEGRVFAIDPMVDPSTRNISVKALIDNPEGSLRPGMFAYITVNLAERENAFMVPEEALIPFGKQVKVMKIVDGKAVMADVTVGIRRDGMVELASGVAAGDIIVTAGHSKLQDGAPAQIIPGNPQESQSKPSEMQGE